MIPFAVNSNNTPIVLLVADIEELVVVKAVLAPRGDVRFDVVELAEEVCELDVPPVVEVGMAEY